MRQILEKIWEYNEAVCQLFIDFKNAYGSVRRDVLCNIRIELVIHSLVFSLEGRAWQEPEPSHVTGKALAHCILGKFLGVVCHCFPPPLDVPTLAARCLRPQRRERSYQRKVELWARKMSGSNFA